LVSVARPMLGRAIDRSFLVVAALDGAAVADASVRAGQREALHPRPVRQVRRQNDRGFRWRQPYQAMS